MKTELDEERTKRRAIEEELRRVTVFISNLCPEQFSATQTQPDSATQSPDDRYLKVYVRFVLFTGLPTGRYNIRSHNGLAGVKISHPERQWS
ncbi:hypothetical protein YC2023_048676 [Brassica napus]